MEVAFTDRVMVEEYDPFQQGSQAYLAATDIEIGFLSKNKVSKSPYDQDELQKVVVQVGYPHLHMHRGMAINN